MSADRYEIDIATALLRSGGVVAFPTETVYGLGADVLNPAAVQRIFTIKGRPAHHPLIVHIPGAAHLERWARDIPMAAFTLAKRYWPGPLTLILKRAAQVPDSVTGDQDTVGLRVPDHPLALALLHGFGGGIAAPSANRFGRLSPTRVEHVRTELGAEVDIILDGGACHIGLESTIVSLVGDKPLILRPGSIPAQAIAEILGEHIPLAAGRGSTPRASGMLAAHYAPRTPLRIVARTELLQVIQALRARGRQVGVLELNHREGALGDSEPEWHRGIMPATPQAYAHDLYAALHRLDDEQLDCLLIEAVPDTTPWLAIADRLRRAAHAHAHAAYFSPLAGEARVSSSVTAQEAALIGI